MSMKEKNRYFGTLVPLGTLYIEGFILALKVFPGGPCLPLRRPAWSFGALIGHLGAHLKISVIMQGAPLGLC